MPGGGWVTLIQSPAYGTSNLIYKATLINTWATAWCFISLSNGLESIPIVWDTSLAPLGNMKFPQDWLSTDKQCSGPAVQEYGWELRAYCGAYTLSPAAVEVQYAEHKGYGDRLSDYHFNWEVMPSASGFSPLPLVDSPPANKTRTIRSMTITNSDSVTHGYWLWEADEDGVTNRIWIENLGNIPAGKTLVWPIKGRAHTISPGRSIGIWKNSADTTSTTLACASYLEAGGHPDVGPSDEGPWTNSYPIASRRCVSFDGAQDRLNKYPDPASAIGIADHFTIMGWIWQAGWNPNLQYIFCLGSGSNPGAIHVYRNTQLPYKPLEIDLHEGSVTKKKYRWDPDLELFTWKCWAAVWDGTADTLRVFIDGVEDPPEGDQIQVDDPVGTLTDTNRHISVGGMQSASNDGYEGDIWACMAWDEVLSDEEIYYLAQPVNAHFNLNTARGPYTAGHAAALQHWYMPGRRYSTNLGKDFALGGTPIDLPYENSLSNADLVNNWPGK